MTPLRLILSSLRYHVRSHLAVMLGVAAGTAVLTGALLVGDSVRGSLRDLTLDRLGRIDTVLVADRFFRQELADELRENLAASATGAEFTAVQPALLITGTVESPDRKTFAQATLLGVEPGFWSLSRDAAAGDASRPPLARREIVLNRPLADELGVAVGDDLLIRVRLPSDVPTESALGRKEAEPETSRMVVADIIPAEGLGRFGLSPNQQLPHNAYTSLAALQAVVEQDERANVLLLAAAEADTPATAAAIDALPSALRPRLTDLGVTITAGALPDSTERYFSLSSDRMLLPEYLERRALDVFAAEGAQPAYTYLANTIALAEGAAADGAEEPEAAAAGIPYSTIAALDLPQQPPFGPFVSFDGKPIGPLAGDEIVLNDWAADDLGAQPGDAIRIDYFEPESTHGETREASATFRLKAIARLAGPAADRLLTPEVKGVTDEDSIANWDPPFPYDGTRIRDRDETYWDDHRATPKAFVSLAAGRKLWSSRFGRTTSIRIPARDGLTAETIAERLALDPARMGLSFQPVKSQGLRAASGTTPFGLLFLGFSFFIIAAAVMLVALLFRLGIEQRAREVGILLATGIGRRRTLWMLVVEGLGVAAVGGLLGAALGVGYAWLMLAGLRTWWLAAVTAPFLELHLGWESLPSLAIGYVGGVAASLLAICWAAWRMRGVSVRRLLANQSEAAWSEKTSRRWPGLLGWGTLALALIVGVAALRLSGEAQAAAFFGSGALVLSAGLTFVWRRLKSGTTGSVVSVGGAPLARLAVRNGARNPGRSALTIGLVASATFLIVAISAFRLAPPDDVERRDTGSGGFALLAESASPLLHDLNSAAGREELGISAAENELAGVRTYALRVRPGDDASCLNLYQTAKPRVLGAPASLVERGGFAWGPTAAETPEETANPWLLLDRELTADPEGRSVVPVVLDANTATYSLRKGLGDEMTLGAAGGEEFVARIVGLLKNSLFQGDLVMGEAAFVRLFPDQPGYRFFLIAAPADRQRAVIEALEGGLSDQGFDVQTTQARLEGFMAVQNTYLSTFQSLGGLGLLLGTFGLAAVQLRNVLERRGELALMRAVGFCRGRLARMVTLENFALLTGGLVLGIVAALVAVLPHLLAGGANLPWGPLSATLGIVLVVGLLAGMLAVRATLRAPLLPALRGE